MNWPVLAGGRRVPPPGVAAETVFGWPERPLRGSTGAAHLGSLRGQHGSPSGAAPPPGLAADDEGCPLRGSTGAAHLGPSGDNTVRHAGPRRRQDSPPKTADVRCAEARAPLTWVPPG